MKSAALQLCIPRPGQVWKPAQLAAVNPCLENMAAEARVVWALEYLPDNPLLTSSFGAQSAVMLHLVSRQAPGIPVLLIDTGYLFPETYQFIDHLVERLELNLKVIRPEHSAAWQEARHGRLWESGAEGIRRYNRINKVEPMERALAEQAAGTWFSGLRRNQSDTRKDISILQARGSTVKVHPIADWSNRDIHRYLIAHDLPYHPLWDDGFVSIGDHHTSRPLDAGMSAQETRFFGLVRECGLHEVDHFGGAGN
jgi:phosphoadenosine phosphosulfate reductase